MAIVAALLLLSSATAPTAASPPAPQARVTATARVRILSPLRVGQMSLSARDARRDPLVTHQAKRRDGARVIDAY
jgi:hypothetical protein